MANLCLLKPSGLEDNVKSSTGCFFSDVVTTGIMLPVTTALKLKETGEIHKENYYIKGKPGKVK